MNTISLKKGGCVLINDQPYQVADLKTKYKSGGIVVKDKFDARVQILSANYTDIINPTTDAAFADIDTLKAFVESNFFDDATGDGGASGTLTAESFGAKGDGTANDTAALLAAISAAAESDMTLYLKPGLYLVDPITLPANTRIRGVHYRTTLKLRPGSASDRQIFLVQGNTDGVYMEGLTLDANRAANSGSNIVPLRVQDNGTGDPINNVKIKNCIFQGSKDRALTWFRGFAITNVEITGSSFLDAGVQAIETRGCKFFKFENNYIYGWGQNNPNAPAFGLQSVTNDYFTITRNYFQNTVGDQFAIESAGAYVQNSVIDGNLFDANHLRAGGCSGYFRRTVFSNNRHINGVGSHRTGYEMIGNEIQVVNNYMDNGAIVFTCDDINPVTELRPNGDTFVCIGNTVKTNAVNQGSLYISGFTTGGADFAIAQNMIVADNSFENRGSTGNAATVSIGFYGSNGYVAAITLENNHIRAAVGQPAFRLRAAATNKSVRILDNNVLSGLNGIRIDNPAAWENVEISGNDFRGVTSTAYVFGSGSFTDQFRVVGNIVTGDIYKAFYLDDGTCVIPGSGSPEGVVPAKPGSLFLNKLGGAGTTMYIKETGTGNTGWAPVAGAVGVALLNQVQTFLQQATFSKTILVNDDAGGLIHNADRGTSIVAAALTSHAKDGTTDNIFLSATRPNDPLQNGFQGWVGQGNNHVYLKTGNTDLHFQINNSELLRMFNTLAVHIQNGGTFTDDSSVIFAVNSQTKGVRLPRMTTAERTAIPVTAARNALLVYDTGLQAYCYYNGTGWRSFDSTAI